MVIKRSEPEMRSPTPQMIGSIHLILGCKKNDKPEPKLSPVTPEITIIIPKRNDTLKEKKKYFDVYKKIHKDFTRENFEIA